MTCWKIWKINYKESEQIDLIYWAMLPLAKYITESQSWVFILMTFSVFFFWSTFLLFPYRKYTTTTTKRQKNGHSLHLDKYTGLKPNSFCVFYNKHSRSLTWERNQKFNSNLLLFLIINISNINISLIIMSVGLPLEGTIIFSHRHHQPGSSHFPNSIKIELPRWCHQPSTSPHCEKVQQMICT